MSEEGRPIESYITVAYFISSFCCSDPWAGLKGLSGNDSPPSALVILNLFQDLIVMEIPKSAAFDGKIKANNCNNDKICVE
jgi:hypothetical protein